MEFNVDVGIFHPFATIVEQLHSSLICGSDAAITIATSRSSQCSTTGVTKAVVCIILSVGWCI